MTPRSPDRAALFLGRYRHLRTLPDDSGTATAWIARDERTGTAVIASVLSLSRAAGLQNAIGFRTPRLAALLEVQHEFPHNQLPDGVKAGEPASVAVAEWFAGISLQEILQLGPLPPRQAAACVAELALVIAALHQLPAVHGAISARSVLAVREDHGVVPTLTQLVSPPVQQSFSPERLHDGAFRAADDVWALHALLFQCLTGTCPAFDGPAAVARLADYDVQAQALQVILDRGFAKKIGERVWRVDDLVDSLKKFLEDSGGGAADSSFTCPMPSWIPEDLAGISKPDENGATPPPVQPACVAPVPPASAVIPDSKPTRASVPPASAAIPDSKATRASVPPARPPASTPPSTRDLRLWILGGGLVLITAGAAAAIGLVSRKPGPREGPSDTPVRVDPSASSERPGPAPVQTLEASAPAARPQATPCIASYLPQATFAIRQDLELVCWEPDAREGAKKLRARIVTGSRGVLNDGMLEWSRLGWYELAVYGVVRTTCCPDAGGLSLPAHLQPCDDLGPIVDRLASAVVYSKKEIPAALADFERTATCLHQRGDSHYAYGQGTGAGSKEAFSVFLSRALRHP
jgi:serine/threonine protein kinase